MTVFCQATVDADGDGYAVTVTGLKPHDQTRVYWCLAKSEDDAARTGLAWFIREMSGAATENVISSPT
jgi:hypothetical protein